VYQGHRLQGNFADSDSEFVSAAPIGGTVKLPDGTVLDLPWCK
jgi:hypothetical protein